MTDSSIVPPSSLSTSKLGILHLFERILLFLLVAILPLEQMLPSLGNRSAPMLLFVLSATYLLVIRPKVLIRTITHPIFIAFGVLLLVAGVLEIAHPNPDATFLFRTAQMIAGAVCVAALCRDRTALSILFGAQALSGLIVFLLFATSSYTQLLEANASSFEEASTLRESIYQDADLLANINRMAFIAAQGAVVAFALGALKRDSVLRAPFWLTTSAACILGTFLTFSRGGVVAAVLGCSVVGLATRRYRGRLILIALGFCIALAVLVPDAVLKRMVFTPQESRRGNLEGRTQVYANALAKMPEYVVAGVGAGHYVEEWAIQSGLGGHKQSAGNYVLGAHNTPLQITIFWGIPGLFFLLVVYYVIYRSLPRRPAVDGLQLAILGTAASFLVLSLVTHTLYAKVFSIGIGVIAGGDCWKLQIWKPRKTIES